MVFWKPAVTQVVWSDNIFDLYLGGDQYIFVEGYWLSWQVFGDFLVLPGKYQDSDSN